MGLVALFFPFWCFVLLAICYAVMWTPYELLIIAVCIDVQFGNASFLHGYLFTTLASVLLVLSVYTKPLFRFYT